MQARLKEIHADLLRKHLERLEHTMETEQEVESDKEKQAEEEDVTHDMDGMPFSNPPIFLKQIMLGIS